MAFPELMVTPSHVKESAGPDQQNGVAEQFGPSPVVMLGSITKLPLKVDPIAGVPFNGLLAVTVPTKLYCVVAACAVAAHKTSSADSVRTDRYLSFMMDLPETLG